MTRKRMDYAVTSMAQLVNQMSLDKKHIATAQCRTAEAEQKRAEAEQKRVEAERVREEARLARVSKEAELLDINRGYTQKVFDTLALARELGFEANDLRLFKDPLAFIESKRPSRDSEPVSATSTGPRPDAGRGTALPSPAQASSHFASHGPAQAQFPSPAQIPSHLAPPHPQYHYPDQYNVSHYNQPPPPQYPNQYQIPHPTYHHPHVAQMNQYHPLQERSVNLPRPGGQPSVISPAETFSAPDIDMINAS
ncbi:uncharacterized protein ARMOST_19560 [Armillaria ostoyae]|uniref:Uncharacterized protein n=1 Tax=Armillaria ostoyae TaxID=47428 RepID=A0A284S4X6_ARMOS|nr:uncharacterized protein ARMOST_19560 [Armillaria ostoyae]